MSDKLWCINVPGPDDIYAAPSKEAAESLAERHNAAMTKYFKKLKKTNSPEELQYYPPLESIKAVVTEWPYCAKSHAESLEEWEETNGNGLSF